MYCELSINELSNEVELVDKLGAVMDCYSSGPPSKLRDALFTLTFQSYHFLRKEF